MSKKRREIVLPRQKKKKNPGSRELRRTRGKSDTTNDRVRKLAPSNWGELQKVAEERKEPQTLEKFKKEHPKDTYWYI